jgi:hypothetical protein
MKNFEYSITGNDVVPQNMIGDIFFGTPSLQFLKVTPVMLFFHIFRVVF